MLCFVRAFPLLTQFCLLAMARVCVQEGIAAAQAGKRLEEDSLRMARFGLLVPVLLLSTLAAVAAHAQDVRASDRMVQAFRDYCINTDPTRIQAEVPKALGTWEPSGIATMADGTIHEWHTLSWMVRGDPHSRLSLRILRTNGVPSACSADAVWPEKSEIIKLLAASVVLGEATSTYDLSSEITRWTIRAHGASAVVELRVPKYAAEPGRSLTIRFGETGARTGVTW